MTETTPVPVDPVKVTLDWLRPILPTILPGWTAGARIAPNVTPSKFVLVKSLSGAQRNKVADQQTVAFQCWGDDGITDSYDRARACRIITAHAFRGLGMRRSSNPVPLPDPTNPERYITQITATALLRGEDQ